MQKNVAEREALKVEKHFIRTTTTNKCGQAGKRISKILETAGLEIVGVTIATTLTIQVAGGGHEGQNDQILNAVQDIRKILPKHGVTAYSDAPSTLAGRRISTDQRCDD